MVLKCQMLISTTQRHKLNKFYKGLKNLILQQLLIKPATRRVAGRSLAVGFIFLFVAGLKANSCNI